MERTCTSTHAPLWDSPPWVCAWSTQMVSSASDTMPDAASSVAPLLQQLLLGLEKEDGGGAEEEMGRGE